jgi:nicotinamide riboside transporter PnuC
VETDPVEVRPVPLRVAGVIGLASAVVYFIVILGQDDRSLLPLALFWLAVMTGSALLAWYAGESEKRGRRMARTAAAGFFLVGLFTNPFFAVVFLVAVVLCVVGSARFEEPSRQI